MGNRSAERILTSTVGERSLGDSAVTRWRPVWRQRLVVASLVLSDVLLAVLICTVAYALQSVWGDGRLSEVARAVTVPSIAVWIGLRVQLGLYPGYGLDSVERLRRHVYSVCGTVAILAVFALGLQIGDLISRLVLGVTFLGLLFITPLSQYLTRRVLKRLELWGKPVVILGYLDTGAQLVDLLKQEWGLGYMPVGLSENHLIPAGSGFRTTTYAKALTMAMDVGRRRKIDTCILATPHTRREQLADMVHIVSETFEHVMVMPNLSGVTNSAVVARDLSGTLAVEIKHNLLNPWAQRLKRALDLFGAVVGGFFICPLLLTIAVLIKLNSRGPVIFVQERPGLSGDMF